MEWHWNPSRWIFDHWQRKLVALITAVIMWVLVNNSIIDTKTIPNIAVKVIDLPSDRAIVGLLPNGLLSRHITLTLSGTKDVISELEAGDIQVVLDASAIEGDEWIVDVTKKNLVSLNPAINLAKHITQVSHGDFIIKMSRLVNDKVPVTVLSPTGEPPHGYSFVDIWPQQFFQTLSGTAEEIAEIRNKGLQLTLDMSLINKADLEQAQTTGNEVVFFVPNKWKKIAIPYRDRNESDVELNDSDAKQLQMTFLPEQWLPFDTQIPVFAYYPAVTLGSFNPGTRPLVTGGKLTKEHGVQMLKGPLYLFDVSNFFLKQIENSLAIIVAVSPQPGLQMLPWSLEVVDVPTLENAYVNGLLAQEQYGNIRHRKKLLKRRFQIYLQRLALYVHPGQKLHLECILGADAITIQ